MCGRYYIDDSMIGRIEKTLSGIDNRLNGKTFSGDIYPTNTAPVISAASDHLQLEETRWGYPGMNKKGVIINARAETVQEKRMFHVGIDNGRIVIPAVHFYEWNPQKTKYTFHQIDCVEDPDDVSVGQKRAPAVDYNVPLVKHFSG